MADTDYLAASDGTGDAALMHVTTPRTAGATIIQVDTVIGVPAFFIGTYGTLGSNGFITSASKRDFFGHINAGTLVIDKFAAGNTDNGNLSGDVVVIKPNTATQNLVSDFIKNGVVAGAGGWNVLGPTPNTITALGNRSYSMVFNARDLTSSFSAGMRIRTTRTVAAPTQCTTLNGTNQFWSKATPAGMTFTDNFTVSGWVKLSSYAQGVIMSRYNGTSGWVLRTTAAGQIEMYGFNAGAGNYRGSQSYQSLPLNKWVHVAFSLGGGMTSGLLYIDGVLVPTSAQSGGTLPSALIQAGNIEVGSWNGGTLLFPGKIAQAAVFSAVLSQATIQAQISQGLAGTETSLVSAYSFNGNANDLNTTNANNLTSNNGAAATTADSFNGAQANGTISSTLDYGIVHSATFSTNTTLIIQVPEGCTIPTSGGVSAVAYSGVKAPYGMPMQEGKWDILAKYKTSTNVSNTGIAQYAGQQIVAPVGEWRCFFNAAMYLVGNASGQSAYFGLSTSTSAFTEDELQLQLNTQVTSTVLQIPVSATKPLSVLTATPYYVVGQVSAAAVTAGLSASNPAETIVLKNAYL
jgi:hypothetical protein